jgi:hypothetical protein
VGEVLLVFLDREGYRVTVRVRREAVNRMLERLPLDGR